MAYNFTHGTLRVIGLKLRIEKGSRWKTKRRIYAFFDWREKEDWVILFLD